MLCRLAPMKASLRFEFLRERQLPLRGASGVASVDGALFIVEDDDGIFRVKGKDAELWAGRKTHPALGDLEGIAADRTGKTLWALAENDGTVLAFSLRGSSRRPKVVGRLTRPGSRKNKGFEGLAFLPARLSPSRRASLIAVHEARPRRVGIFALPGLEQTHDLKLPPDAKDLLEDLADVTVDPVSGAVLLLSDQSRRVAVVRIAGGRLALVGSFDLPLGRKEKPEGIDFAGPARLMIVTDDSGKLLEFAVRRSGD